MARLTSDSLWWSTLNFRVYSLRYQVLVCQVLVCQVLVCQVLVCQVLVCQVLVCQVLVCQVLVCQVLVCQVLVFQVLVCQVLVCQVRVCLVRVCQVLVCQVLVCQVLVCQVLAQYCVSTHCNFGAAICTEIPGTFAWGRKVPSQYLWRTTAPPRLVCMEQLEIVYAVQSTITWSFQKGFGEPHNVVSSTVGPVFFIGLFNDLVWFSVQVVVVVSYSCLQTYPTTAPWHEQGGEYASLPCWYIACAYSDDS